MKVTFFDLGRDNGSPSGEIDAVCHEELLRLARPFLASREIEFVTNGPAHNFGSVVVGGCRVVGYFRLGERPGIDERIRQNYETNVKYFDLMRAVFPPAEFPRAWNYRVDGGPPGCAMAFGAALRRLGLMRFTGRGGEMVGKTDRCEF